MPSRAVVSADRLTYPGIFPGVDLVLEVTPEGLKEFVVLTKRPDKPLSLRFPFSLQGVRPKELASGDISFVGGDGKSAFALPRGWMFDSSGSEQKEPAVSEAVDFDLDLKSRQPAITLTPDSRWLADPARVYPVMVDPTVETINPSPDCFITNGTSADTTHCNEAKLRVGWDGTLKRRGLLKFPVEQLPDGAYVTDADLKLYLTDSTTTRVAPIEVHRLTSSWAGGVTWKRRTWDNQNLWGTQGGDFTSFVWATRDISGTAVGYKSWDVTSLVREWRKPDGSPNYGMILKQDTENINNHLMFATNQAAESQWPKLVVQYGSVTTDIAEWTTDTSTGATSYNFSVSASGLNLAGDPAGPCYAPADCEWHVQAKYTDGSEEALYGDYFGHGRLEENTASFAKTFSGTLSHEITHIRAWVESYRCPTGAICDQSWHDYDSGWIKVHDPYPRGDVSLSIGKWLRDPETGQVEYDLTVSAAGASQWGGPCEQIGCNWSVDVLYENGSTFRLGGSGDQLEAGTWVFTENLSGTTTLPYKVTHLRARLESGCGNGTWCNHRRENYTTDWIFVGDHMANGEDLIPYEAALGAALAASPSTFCDVLLAAGGALPSVDGNTMPDAYERCIAITQAAAPTIRKVLASIALAGGAQLAYELLLDEHANEGPVPNPEEEETPPPPWTPPDVWEDNGCHWESIQYTAESEQHLKDEGHLYEFRKPGKSYFFSWVKVKPLAEKYALREMPVPDPTNSNSCRRIVTYLGGDVGIDRNEAQRTNVYTVITWKDSGDVLTMFPGRPKV